MYIVSIGYTDILSLSLSLSPKPPTEAPPPRHNSLSPPENNFIYLSCQGSAPA